MCTNSGRGWYHRGYLPHLDVQGRRQAITFRLADSLPGEVIERWKAELAEHPTEDQRERMRRRVACYEDRGAGKCWLARPEVATLVVTALRHFEGARYHLVEWCVMPNHVHVLFDCLGETSLAQMVRSWKNFTAREINLRIGTQGRFWAPDYHDRLIRDEDHLMRARRYIRMNPVKAGLCRRPEEWLFGSAYEPG